MGIITKTIIVCFIAFSLLATYNAQQTYKVHEGDVLSIHCDVNATESTNSYFYWMRNDTARSFVVNGTELTFDNTNRTSSGGYVCTESTTVNDTTDVEIVDTVIIDVQYAPKPVPSQQYIVQAYNDVAETVLIMQYTANPVPNITWEHRGRILTNYHDVKRSNMAVRINYLNVTSISVADFDSNYSLTMSNAVGSCRAEYKIVAWGPPAIPRNLNAYNITSNSVTLQWTSGFDNGSPQSFTVMSKSWDRPYFPTFDVVKDKSKNHGVNQTWTYTMTGLWSGTDYTMTVYSKNNYGESYTSATPVTFQTEGNGGSPSESSSTKLTCDLFLVTLLAMFVWLHVQ